MPGLNLSCLLTLVENFYKLYSSFCPSFPHYCRPISDTSLDIHLESFMSSTWQKTIFCPGKTEFILPLSQISEGCLPEQVQGEVEMEDDWCRRAKWNGSDAFGQLLEIACLHGRVTYQNNVTWIPASPWARSQSPYSTFQCLFFRNGLGREYSFKEKALPSKWGSFFRSLEISVPNGFPLLFAKLSGERWEAGMPRTFCSEACAAFRIV